MFNKGDIDELREAWKSFKDEREERIKGRFNRRLDYMFKNLSAHFDSAVVKPMEEQGKSKTLIEFSTENIYSNMQSFEFSNRERVTGIAAENLLQISGFNRLLSKCRDADIGLNLSFNRVPNKWPDSPFEDFISIEIDKNSHFADSNIKHYMLDAKHHHPVLTV